MRSCLRFFDPVFRPTIVTSADLWRYMCAVTLLVLLLSSSVFTINHVLFVTPWRYTKWAFVMMVANVLVSSGTFTLIVGRTQRDLYEAKQRVELLSRTDVLTGLPNRRALMERIDTMTGQLMVLVIADIDRFKAVNDTHGHRAGDIVIRRIAQMMADALSDCGIVARLGGEEFAVVAPMDAAAGVLAAFEGFRSRLAERALDTEGVAIPVSISAGATIQSPGENFDAVYARADAALYRAKAAGRNRIELSPPLRDMVATLGDGTWPSPRGMVPRQPERRAEPARESSVHPGE